MSLLSTDIRKVGRLSLKDIELPVPESRELKPNTKAKEVEDPLTGEELDYTQIVRENRLIKELVDRLELVSVRTKRPLRVDPQDKKEPINTTKLIALAERLLKGETTYSKEEIITKLQEATKVGRDRAEVGFTKMLDSGAIDGIIGGERYYLSTSTPF